MSMFLGLMRFLLSDTSCPAFENNLSDGTDDPGMHRYFFASCCSRGNLFSLFFHHSSGFLIRSILGSSKYCRTSISESDVLVLCDRDCVTLLSKSSQRLHVDDVDSELLVSSVSGDCWMFKLDISCVTLDIVWSIADVPENGSFLKRGSSRVVTAVVNEISRELKRRHSSVVSVVANVVDDWQDEHFFGGILLMVKS